MKTIYKKLNTYDADNQVCPCCHTGGEMVYTQSVQLWICQVCGENSEED